MKSYGLRPVIQKDEAVSPIIATILLVAITVILASTLYLALGGFFTSKTNATPTVGLSATNTTTSSTGPYTFSVTLGTPSSNTVSWSSVDWVIIVAGTTYTANVYSAGTWTFTGAAGTGTSATAGTITVSGATGTYMTGGIILSLSINFGTVTGTPVAGAITTLAVDYTGSGAGQMGTTSL